MHHILVRIALLCCMLFFKQALAYGQPETPATKFNNTIELVLPSKILNEDRIIYIHLPEDWQEKAYPVFILIDGEYIELYEEALHAINTNKDVSEHIVVGIDNHLNRNRDLLPVKVENRPGSGEAHKFLQFLQQELIPHLNQRYNASQERILFGGSNGGLFTLYAFFAAPELFSGYIASSAMIGHCPDFMEEQLRTFTHLNQVKGKTLFLHYGMKDPFKQATDYLPAYAKKLKTYLGNRFPIKSICLPEGGHVPPGGIEQGLTFYHTNKTKATK
ncbi:MAG: alpha/beta hydrolase [Bacteroidota bacterium]